MGLDMDVTESPAPDADAGLERIKRLEERLALEPDDSAARREIAKVVRIEAGLYRRSLDVRQAAAIHSKKSERCTIKCGISGASWK
jgi:hypothetical protein